MTHGDDQGLVLPPRLAPYQVVIVPIFRNDSEKSQVMPVVERIEHELLNAGVRLKTDSREEVTPGFKFNDWEMRGVPLRIEIGPRDVAKGTVAFARRDIPGKAGKTFVTQTGLGNQVVAMLETIQDSLLAKATAFRDSHIHAAERYDQLQEIVQDGWAKAWWCGNAECENQIKSDTRATNRCMPLDEQTGEGACIVCGKPAESVTLFARAY
jgi:prolyl-tRNA synthetase